MHNFLFQSAPVLPIRIIVSVSSSSKLSSRLIFLRFTRRIPISLQQNLTTPKSSEKVNHNLRIQQYKVF